MTAPSELPPTTAPAAEPAPGPAAAPGRTLPWWGFGLANVAVVVVLSLVSWWLLIDPEWSVLGSYPQPYTAMLFWTIIATVWLSFTFGWLGPARLPQPVRGLVGMAIALVLGIGITLLVAYVYGAVDPTFAASREGGAGFTTSNLVVLFAFFFYVTAVVNWGQWPWASVEQPLKGLGELGVLAVPTIAFYALLVLPNLATWGDPASALFSVPTLIGWFYCVIVAVVVTGVICDNLPWSLAGGGVRTVAVSLIGNILLGTVIYYVLLFGATVLMGPANAAGLGAGVTVHAAQLGVCWVFWMVAWANVFGNRPTHLGAAANSAIRLGITLVLGVLTYPLYFFVLAPAVLHEPVVAGTTLYGDALGFMDVLVLWTLWYVLFLGSYGLPRPREEVLS